MTNIKTSVGPTVEELEEAHTHVEPVILKKVNSKDVFAGNFIVTVSDPEGRRVTMKVSTVTQEEREPKSISFVSVLNGPDNTRNYAYLGVLDVSPTQTTSGVYVRKTAKSRHLPQHKMIVEWLLWHLLNEQPLPEGYELRNAGRCFRCGRLLTVPSSIDANYGPECAQKQQVMK